MGALAGCIARMLEWRLRRIESSTADPLPCQIAVLRNLLRRAADTELGRQYRFAEIASPEQFRARVPIMPYETACTFWHRAFDGATDIAWPGHVRYFALSSGTTAGNKLIPVTADAIKSNRRAGMMVLAYLTRRGDAASLLEGQFLYLGGSTTLRSRGRCLVGDASAIMALHVPWYARRRVLPDPQTMAITDWEAKIRRIVENYLHADVRALSACPSWAALFFRQMIAAAQAAGDPNPAVGRLWPAFSHFVSYGMAFEPYRNAFDEYVGRPIHYLDTYSSSEGGMTAIQDEPGGPMRLLVDNGVFYEFVPAERAEESDPPRLHIGEVEENRDYALLLSTNGGIWAYPLGDVVRFVSLRPARVVFSGRTQIYLSAFGEHVTLGMIEKAVAAAAAATSAVVADYTVAPRFPSAQQPRPAHRWIMEFARPPGDLNMFADVLDRTIRAENEDYDTHRANDFGLEKPLLMPVARGTFYEWMKSKGKLGGQHKVPRVARSAAMVDELLAISQTLAGGRNT